MSAQQQPTHQAPFFAPIWSAPTRPRAKSRGGSRAGCGTCRGRRPSAVSARRRPPRRASRRRPTGRRDPRRARRPTIAVDAAADGESEHTGERPRERDNPPRRAAATADDRRGSCASTAPPSARPTGTSSPPSSRPKRRGTSPASRGRSTVRCPSPASRVDRPPPADPGEREKQSDQAQPGAHGRERRAEPPRSGPVGRRRDHAFRRPRRTRTSKVRSCLRTGSRRR